MGVDTSIDEFFDERLKRVLGAPPETAGAGFWYPAVSPEKVSGASSEASRQPREGSRRPGRPKGQSYLEPATLVMIRHRLKLSQENLARMIGVSRATLSMWENGRAPIPKSAAELIEQLGQDVPEQLNMN